MTRDFTMPAPGGTLAGFISGDEFKVVLYERPPALVPLVLTPLPTLGTELDASPEDYEHLVEMSTKDDDEMGLFPPLAPK